MVAPLVVGNPHRGRGSMDKSRGNRELEALRKETLEWRKVILLFSVNTSEYTMPINIEEKYVNMIVGAGSSCNNYSLVPAAT